MKNLAFLFVAMTMVAAHVSRATELDPPTTAAPQGLIVRTDSQGNTSVFKTEGTFSVTDATSAAAAVKANVKTENQIENVATVNELDEVSSTEAWCRWYNPGFSNFYYSYNYLNYSYYYQPYYNWNFGAYNYYYYYRW